MSLESWCPYCGCIKPNHHTWCQQDLVEKQRTLRDSTPSEPRQLSPARVVPPEELFGRREPLPPQELPAQSGGFKRTEAEIEREAGERRILVVVEWDWKEPDKTHAYLVEVLIKPDGSFVERDRRKLLQAGHSLASEKVPNSLRREPYGVVISLEPHPLKRLDELQADVRDAALAIGSVRGIIRRPW